jgi:hypothetical protein
MTQMKRKHTFAVLRKDLVILPTTDVILEQESDAGSVTPMNCAPVTSVRTVLLTKEVFDADVNLWQVDESYYGTMTI